MDAERNTDNSLECLNKAQREAVQHKEGPLLVLAGAGAGKTRVITHRIAKLIRSGTAAEHILAVTFTNKAAREMRERVHQLLRSDAALRTSAGSAGTPYIATFHALGVRLLRGHSRAAGVPARFIIYDRSDSQRAVKEAMRGAGVDPQRFEPRTVLGSISRAKGDGTALGEFTEGASEYYQGVVARVWERYEESLVRARALDFDDLLLKSARMLRAHPDILRTYHDRFRYIHVDEYQDTNRIQYELLQLLVGEKRNVCVVGDIDQMVYSWRGADIDNLLRFEKTFPGTSVVVLEQNYRSSKTILDASNAVIAKNTKRVEKKLFTDRAGGEPISVCGCGDETKEAYFVAGKAKELITHGVAPREVAVLYRANFQSRALEEACLSYDIPYQVLGVRFFQRKEIKDTLAYIRAALDPASTADLARIINVPARGIGKVTLLKIIEGREEALSSAMQKRVAAFKRTLESVREAAETKPPSEVVKTVLRASGLEEALSRGSDKDAERLENIKELVTLATRYDPPAGGSPEEGTRAEAQVGITPLLEDAALASDQDELREEQNAVRLMTVHASKGLEFDCVFITGLEEGLFPHPPALGRGGEGFDADRDEEEERRLFYVALTRARKKVFLSFAAVRTIFGSRNHTMPSSFLSDIDEGLLEVEDMRTREAHERIIE